MTDITAKLDRLAELRAAPDAIRLAKQALVDTILTAEIKAQLAEIDAEFAPKLQAAQEAAELLEAEIKLDVLANGATVKGGALMAVWNKGRVSWDSKRLEGMMALIPQLSQARTEGQPSITIRSI
jgi:hypothetical protein